MLPSNKSFSNRGLQILACMLLGISLFWQPGDLGAAVAVTRGPYLQMGTPTSVLVRWRTASSTDSRVGYGTDPANLNLTAGNGTLTTEHIVAVTGLTPDTKYYYSVGSSTETQAGGISYTFFTAPPPGTVQPVRIWVLGDSGTAGSSAAAVRNAYTNFTGNRYTDLWLMLGDNAYDSGTDSEYQAAVFNMYPSFLRQSVLWPTIGNHDTGQSTNPSSSLPYYQIFSLPTNGESGGVPSGTEDYYSFDYANIHFICLDSMTSDRSPNGPMLTWLRADISNTTRNWIIAFWHHPPYSKGSHDSDSETQLIQMRQNALPILENYGVDLVLSGHSHSYERSYLLDGHYGSSGTLTGSMIKDSGSGREDGSGAYEKPIGGTAPHQGAVYAVAGSSGQTSGVSRHPAMVVWLNNLGSMVLDVDGNRLDAKFLRENGSVADYFTMLKGTGGSPNTAPTVSVTSPANGASFNAPASISIAATASDSDGSVAKVEFFQGSTKLGEDTTAPYSFPWSNVAAGSYALTARATDNLGATKTSGTVNVTVNGSTTNQPPSISITSPANGATFTAPAAFSLAATASDPDGSIAKVEFFQGANKLGEDKSPPYSLSFSKVQAATYTVSAKATDNLGATTTSAAVTFTVNNGGTTNNPPSVGLTSPANGATFTSPAGFTLAATAADSDGSVAKVEFFQGSTKLGEDTTAPYQWPLSNVAAGSYAFTARATDNLGATTTSGPVGVTVSGASGVLVAPTNLVVQGETGQIKVSWTQSASPNIVQNKIYRSPGGPWVLIATIPAATTYTDRAVVLGRVYYYTVTGVDSSGRETPGCPYAGAAAR